MKSVLFVCMGNICRSPMAEGILRKLATERGLNIEIDSAGTGDWHAGTNMDVRAAQVLHQHSADFLHAARLVNANDKKYNYIVLMDQQNFHDLSKLQPELASRASMMMAYCSNDTQTEVPDPYAGNIKDFENVYEMLLRAVTAFADQELM